MNCWEHIKKWGIKWFHWRSSKPIRKILLWSSLGLLRILLRLRICLMCLWRKGLWLSVRKLFGIVLLGKVLKEVKRTQSRRNDVNIFTIYKIVHNQRITNISINKSYLFNVPFLIISPIEFPLYDFGTVCLAGLIAVSDFTIKSINNVLIRIGWDFLQSESLPFQTLSWLLEHRSTILIRVCCYG